MRERDGGKWIEKRKKRKREKKGGRYNGEKKKGEREQYEHISKQSTMCVCRWVGGGGRKP